MPAKVILFCPMLEFKNKPATLMTISPHGYYECRVDMAAGNHTVYVPIAGHGDDLPGAQRHRRDPARRRALLKVSKQ